jgi:L-threonylcarbamoyladenylate synthase
MTKKTVIVNMDLDCPEPGQGEILLRVLRDDGVMVFPTETFYGLGVSAFSGRAVAEVYHLKKRDRDKPLSVVVSDFAMAERVADSPPPLFRTLADAFWPGPLTLVVGARPLFPVAMLGPGGSLAIRVPGLPWLVDLIGRLGIPLTATSANVSGGGEISDPAQIILEFEGKVDVIVDSGPTPGGLPSTVIDLTSKSPRIIREGAVPRSALRKYL